jgi:hypothetical protein
MLGQGVGFRLRKGNHDDDCTYGSNEQNVRLGGASSSTRDERRFKLYFFFFVQSSMIPSPYFLKKCSYQHSNPSSFRDLLDYRAVESE